MSKPNKSGELRNVEVSAISIVQRAANRERFKIFKSEENEDTKSATQTGISSSAFDKIKSIHADLAAILDNLETNEENQENNNTKFDAQEIKNAVQDAIKPLDERIANLEAAPEKEKELPKIQVPDVLNVAEVVKNAISEALIPLAARVTKIEKARGLSNRVPEDTTIQKNSDGFWGQIF